MCRPSPITSTCLRKWLPSWSRRAVRKITHPTAYDQSRANPARLFHFAVTTYDNSWPPGLRSNGCSKHSMPWPILRGAQWHCAERASEAAVANCIAGWIEYLRQNDSYAHEAAVVNWRWLMVV